MKTAIKGILTIAILTAGVSCSKVNNGEMERGNCKTCRVLGSNPEVKEQVCNDEEAQAFYRRNSGAEITCTQ